MISENRVKSQGGGGYEGRGGNYGCSLPLVPKDRQLRVGDDKWK